MELVIGVTGNRGFKGIIFVIADFGGPRNFAELRQRPSNGITRCMASTYAVSAQLSRDLCKTISLPKSLLDKHLRSPGRSQKTAVFNASMQLAGLSGQFSRRYDSTHESEGHTG